MHPKQKGDIGATAVSLEFMKNDWAVFMDLGDLSKIDLIAEKGGKLLRIQVKARHRKNGSLTLKTTKSGPNYRFSYDQEMFDYFALVDLDTYECYLVPSSICGEMKTFTLRLDDKPVIDGKNRKSYSAKEYEFEKVLKEIA